jgi:hypothetical protein
LTLRPGFATKDRHSRNGTAVTDSPPDSLIPYDDIVQDALRGVVERVLRRIDAAGGLPGGHHFYIAFRTRAAGVDIPKHLIERYPEEMTIVVQHRYWDLLVDPDFFEIGLSFNQVPAKLHIPYSAITGFVDPAVNFALQFPAPADVMPPPPPEPAPSAGPGGSEGSGSEGGNSENGGNVVALDRFRRK